MIGGFQLDKKFFYQPDLPTSVTCWSYTLIILSISILLWLEITVFQIWTVLVFLLFLLVSGIQIYFRQVEVRPDRVVLKTVIPQNNKVLQRSELFVSKQPHGCLLFKTKLQTYRIYLLPAARNKLYDLIQK
ncbi:hypothetical protein FD21_GL001295 [Liquorilactobacillus vini DSM 20605]|uniref:Pore-forming protein n=1 Tax=Liquorilactobacillus vini DSM 20605 TaxID=1133569 RepID=A0A0R2C7D4_9LACO|nr:hypothetical protein FD21_GL001295 [Liquorilactobacillus vini DSM 20605]